MNLIGLAQEVEERLAAVDKPVKVAVMGCVVNGPGEAADADIGVACGAGAGVVFSHGKIVRKSARRLGNCFCPYGGVGEPIPQILRMSNLYAPTLKEDPSGTDIDSARLLLRAGMLRKAASGLYTFLPLGFRVLKKKIENIVREEMDASGAQEILMPVLQPAELWEESGRLNDYGPELMRLTDRHDREMCLVPHP